MESYDCLESNTCCWNHLIFVLNPNIFIESSDYYGVFMSLKESYDFVFQSHDFNGIYTFAWNLNLVMESLYCNWISRSFYKIIGFSCNTYF